MFSSLRGRSLSADILFTSAHLPLFFWVTISIAKSYFSSSSKKKKKGGELRISVVLYKEHQSYISPFVYLLCCACKSQRQTNPTLSSIMKADSSALITKLGGLGIIPLLWSLAWCQALLCPSGREHRTEESFPQHNICFFVTGKTFARKHQCWLKHEGMAGRMAVPFSFFVWLQNSLNFFNSCWLLFSLILWIQKINICNSHYPCFGFIFKSKLLSVTLQSL